MSFRIIIIFSIIAMPFCLVAQQYSGGSGNGFNVRDKPNTILTTIGTDSVYKGGINNGFNNRQGTTLILGVADSLYIGSSGNGLSNGYGLVIQLGVNDSLYIGGDGTGFTTYAGNLVTLHIADSLYTGGHGNGFNNFIIISTPIFIADSLYNGGFGRGEITIAGKVNLDTCGITVTWNGSLSNVWANAANWDCGVVPGITSNVFIPSGVARYPIIFSPTEIRSLSIQNGASVTVKTAVHFKINGH